MGIDILGTYIKITLEWTPEDLHDCNSTLVLVMGLLPDT